jgi:hypothetical protein
VEELSSHLLNVHNVSDVRQIEIHTAESLVPGPSHLEIEIAISNFKKCKPPGSDQILAELIKAGDVCSPQSLSFHLEKKNLPEQWKESIIVPCKI